MKKDILLKVIIVLLLLIVMGVSVIKVGGEIRGFVAIGIVSFVYIKIILLMEMKND